MHKLKLNSIVSLISITALFVIVVPVFAEVITMNPSTHMNQTMPFNATQATNGNNNMIDTMSNNSSIGENPSTHMNQTMPFNATQATNGNNNMIDTMSNNSSIGENPMVHT